jgi:hypothetical protein
MEVLSMQNALDNFWAWLPNLIGAVVILLVGWLIARLVAAAVRRGLKGLGADRVVEEGSVGRYKQGVAPRLSVSDLVATITFWFVLGVAIVLALGALQIPELSALIGGIVAYLPNVIAAILILVVGVALAAGIGAITQRIAGGTMLGRIVETALPAVIVAIAISMALVQLQIAPMIVLATYVIVLGSLGLGLALAFGLGARTVAGRVVEQGYEEARARAPQAKAEMQEAREHAREEGERVRSEADRRVDERAARSEERAAVRADEVTTTERAETTREPVEWTESERPFGAEGERRDLPDSQRPTGTEGERREWPERPDEAGGQDDTRRIA